MNLSKLLTPERRKDLIEFAQQLVRIKSYSGQEEEIIKFIAQKMISLGFDEVLIDGMGNVIGRIGNGPKVIMLDAHVDTVAVNDKDKWVVPPFEGQISNGRLHGRGSVDMKSSVAASIYSAILAKEAALTIGKTIYITATVFEEDCDGENLKHLFNELRLRPDFMVICEPSNNKIALGHKGKAQIAITTQGISAHGAAPEKGVNAIYEMAEIIQRVELANKELAQKEGLNGTLVLSRISSISASLNAVPSTCEIYLDRRTVLGETEEQIKEEMNKLIRDKNATWQVGTLHRKSWTGLDIEYKPFHTAWKIEKGHELTKACVTAFQNVFNTEEAEFDYWDFSTNAVTPVALGIPTIAFGPGDYKLAHMRNESCEIKQIEEACAFYVYLIGNL